MLNRNFCIALVLAGASTAVSLLMLYWAHQTTIIVAKIQSEPENSLDQIKKKALQGPTYAKIVGKVVIPDKGTVIQPIFLDSITSALATEITRISESYVIKIVKSKDVNNDNVTYEERSTQKKKKTDLLFAKRTGSLFVEDRSQQIIQVRVEDLPEDLFTRVVTKTISYEDAAKLADEHTLFGVSLALDVSSLLLSAFGIGSWFNSTSWCNATVLYKEASVPVGSSAFLLGNFSLANDQDYFIYSSNAILPSVIAESKQKAIRRQESNGFFLRVAGYTTLTCVAAFTVLYYFAPSHAKNESTEGLLQE